MNLTIRDIYQIGRDAVRLFPANSENPCLQLQTFRVLTRGGGLEIGTENMGAVPSDKDSPFFWSRKWMLSKYSPNALAFDYPVLTLFQSSAETSSAPFRRPYARIYTLELAVLDTYREDCTQGKHSGCAARTINDIYIDTEKLLDSALQYFGEIVIATTDRDDTPKVYYTPALNSMRERGLISSYDLKGRLSDQLTLLNKTVRFSPVDRYSTQKIFGTKCMIQVRVDECGSIEYNTEIEDFGTAAFEAGCTNC